MAVTAASFAPMLAMGLTTTLALTARAEADGQRAEAESLVEFILGDLRQRLKGVGRVSVLGSVNRRTLAYYNRQERGGQPDDSRGAPGGRRSAMGEDEAGQDVYGKDCSMVYWSVIGRRADTPRGSNFYITLVDPVSGKRVRTIFDPSVPDDGGASIS